MDFGWPNAEIGRKMANGRLLFLALDKVCFIFCKCKGMEKKLSYEVNLLLFLFHSAFQKVIIVFCIPALH